MPPAIRHLSQMLMYNWLSWEKQGRRRTHIVDILVAKMSKKIKKELGYFFFTRERDREEEMEEKNMPFICNFGNTARTKERTLSSLVRTTTHTTTKKIMFFCSHLLFFPVSLVLCVVFRRGKKWLTTTSGWWVWIERQKGKRATCVCVYLCRGTMCATDTVRVVIWAVCRNKINKIKKEILKWMN